MSGSAAWPACRLSVTPPVSPRQHRAELQATRAPPPPSQRPRSLPPLHPHALLLPRAPLFCSMPRQHRTSATCLAQSPSLHRQLPPPPPARNSDTCRHIAQPLPQSHSQLQHSHRLLLQPLASLFSSVSFAPPPLPPAPTVAAAATSRARERSAASLGHRASLTGYNERSYKVLMVGGLRSGKSSLLQRAITEQWQDAYSHTERSQQLAARTQLTRQGAALTQRARLTSLCRVCCAGSRLVAAAAEG